jgi:hypothetical protein
VIDARTAAPSLAFPIHPSDGSLTGYGGGISRKRWLLPAQRLIKDVSALSTDDQFSAVSVALPCLSVMQGMNNARLRRA